MFTFQWSSAKFYLFFCFFYFQYIFIVCVIIHIQNQNRDINYWGLSLMSGYRYIYGIRETYKYLSILYLYTWMKACTHANIHAFFFLAWFLLLFSWIILDQLCIREMEVLIESGKYVIYDIDIFAWAHKHAQTGY